MDKASEIAVARDEGEKKGIEKGESKAKREMALKMQSKGFDDCTIAECLNISVEALNALLF